MAPSVIVVSHPLVQHKLTIMRKKDTSTAKFRKLLGELAGLMAYEITRDLTTELEEIETPLQKMMSPLISGKKLALVSILRAGNGLLDGILDLIPSARVGHIGIYRDPKTLKAVEYYFKMPDDLSSRQVLLLDPMLATGHSAVAAATRLKKLSPVSIKYVCLLATPEGIAHFHEIHPDIEIYTAAVDEGLNEKGYIYPGLGDAGDRIYGTK